MKFHLSILAAALLAGLSTQATAQTTGVLNFVGTIVPSSCTIQLTSGGMVDFGQVPYNSLSLDTATDLSPMTVAATFACTGPTQFVVKATDNRNTASENSMLATKNAYGIGSTSSSAPIGMYTIDMNTPVVDGAAGTVIASANLSTWIAPDDATGWEKSNDATSEMYRGFGAAATGPVALRDATVNLRVTPNIQPTQDLQLTQDAVFDGSTTLELTYL